MGKIVIKESTLAQVFKVHRLIPEFADLTFEDFEKRVENKRHLILTALIDQIHVGYMVGLDRYEDGSFYCWMTGVLPNYRKQGVLKTMMDYMDAWAQENYYNSIKIKTRNKRVAMRIALAKMGYMVIYFEPREDNLDSRIVLTKEL